MTEQERQNLIKEGKKVIICGEDKKPCNRGFEGYVTPKYILDLEEMKYFEIDKKSITK